MPINLDQFVGSLAASGVMPLDDLRAVRAAFPQDKTDGDAAKQFAKELVR